VGQNLCLRSVDSVFMVPQNCLLVASSCVACLRRLFTYMRQVPTTQPLRSPSTLFTTHTPTPPPQVWYYSEGPGRDQGLAEGDVLVSNHPQLAGGSHLPDITVITPVFNAGQIVFFVASRGHHADIGGISPGSMPPHSKSLAEEGAAIVSFKIVKQGEFQEEGGWPVGGAAGCWLCKVPWG
jgi:hypothetical protein